MKLLRSAAVSAAAVLAGLFVASEVHADCYVDSVAGNDSNDGQSEATPVQSQEAIPSGCTTVRYKRGSEFNAAVRVVNGVKTYTNYGELCDPLPKFKVVRSPGNGSMFQSTGGGITIDGLYLAGSMGEESQGMGGLGSGVCVMLMGDDNQLLNSEITDCDIGIMLMGSNSLIRGNYIHDLFVVIDCPEGQCDPNAVGGAEGIFINGSNNEVSYNSFIRCTNTADWTGGNCDGGATEVSVFGDEPLTGVKVHHNFSYQSCGFFEVSSGSAGGTFADSEFSYNVAIDSGWLMLLQVNNTNLSNIRWTNNTVVHRKDTAINGGMLVTVFTGTSSGVSGGDLAPNSVFLTNDLFVLEGFGNGYVMPLHENLVLEGTEVIDADPGFVAITGSEPEDFDLVSGSQAIDQGVATEHTLDFLNRSVPAGNAIDMGAFEFGSSLAGDAYVPAHRAVTGCGNTGGSPANASGGSPAETGGTPSTATGGTPAETGGTPSTAAGGSPAETGGTPSTATGGTPAETGGTAPASTGGSPSTPTGGTSPAGTGGTPSTATGGASNPSSSGGALPEATGGTASSTDGIPPSTPSTGGSDTGGSDSAPPLSGGSSSSGVAGAEDTLGGTGPETDTAGADPSPSTGASPARLDDASRLVVSDDESGCGCRAAGSAPGSGGLAWMGALMGALLLARRRAPHQARPTG